MWSACRAPCSPPSSIRCTCTRSCWAACCIRPTCTGKCCFAWRLFRLDHVLSNGGRVGTRTCCECVGWYYIHYKLVPKRLIWTACSKETPKSVQLWSIGEEFCFARTRQKLRHLGSSVSCSGRTITRNIRYKFCSQIPKFEHL